MEVFNSREHSAGSPEVDHRGGKRKGSNRVVASDEGDNYVGAKSKSVEEEVDEWAVEEFLSDIERPSLPPEPTYDQEEGTSTSPVRAQSPAYLPQDTTEESNPTVFRPQHETEKRLDSLPTVLARTSSKLDLPSKKRTRPSSLSPSSAATKSHATTKHRILSEVASRTTARPKKRMRTISLSRQEWEALNDFQSQQLATDSEMVPGHDKSEKGVSEKLPKLDSAGMNLNYSELHPPPPSERSMPGQASRSRAVSLASSGSHSLSGRVTTSISPPISPSKEVGSPSPSATSSTSIVIPTTPPRKGSGANSKEHGHKSPILSPRAKERLKIFDREIKLRGEEGKEQRLDDGGKAKKSRVRGVEEGYDGELVIAGGGRQEEHVLRRTSEEKNWNGKDKEQMKEDKARSSKPKPPEIKKGRNAELSDEPDSQDKPARMPKDSAGGERSQSVEADLAVESNDIDMDTQATGVVEPQLDPIHLRQEVEESTQDLESELLLYQQQQGVGVERSGVPVPEIINDTGDLLPAIQVDSQPISEAMLDTGVQDRGESNNEKSDRFLDEIPSVFIIFVSKTLFLLTPCSRLLLRTQAGHH